MNKKILQLALPSIVSNITVPLLGLVDVAIVGHLGAASYIGAIAVGGMLFNIIYWLFGFLRMGTSGMTSQALGRRDLLEVTRVLFRSVGVGILISLALLLLQYPIREIAFLLLDTTDEVERLASLYFNICIWGAPAVLGLYGFSGWFIGMQNSRFPMFIAITQNREYRGELDLRLCVRHEGTRGCDGNADRPIWGLRDGCIPVVRILSEAVEYSCLLA